MKRIFGLGVLLAAVTLVLALGGCPTESDTSPPAYDITVANAGELSKIAADTSGKGDKADNPLRVKFLASFNDSEIWKLSATDTDDPLMFDSLAGLFEKLTKFVYLDMADATWTGLDETGDGVLSMGLPSAAADANTYLHKWRDNGAKLIGIRFPRTIKMIGSNLFRSATDDVMSALRYVSFQGCGQLEEIGQRAFAQNPDLIQVDFDGCTALEHIDQRAFQNSTKLRTALGTDSIDLSNLTGLHRLNDYAFRNNTATRMVLPATDHLFMGMYAMEAYGVRWLEFKGLTLVDSAWRAHSIYNDKIDNTVQMLPLTHMHESTDGEIGPRTDRVVEIFVPEGLSLSRQYKGYLYSMNHDDGYDWGSMQIPLKNGKDIYRGQASMTIEAKVPNAPAGKVNVYSKKDTGSAFVVGTMQNGTVTLTNPINSNLATLDQTSGMEITFDPRKIHTTEDGAKSNSTTDFAKYDLSGDQWTLDSGSSADGRQIIGATGYYWQPWIGSQEGPLNTSAKFIALASLYYQDGDAWKEIRRSGKDTWVNMHHYFDTQYTAEKRDVLYVYVDSDVTITRNARVSTGKKGDLGDFRGLGSAPQYYWELAEDHVEYASWRSIPWEVNFTSVFISLKKGWNQIEQLSRYADGDDAEWRTIKKAVRVSAGIIGPFSTYNASNTTNFSASAGKAYMTHYNIPEGQTGYGIPPTGPRIYSDEGHQIQIPWIVK